MRFILGFLFVVLTTNALWAEMFEKADMPDWVEQTTVPEVNPDHIAYASGGVYYLLTDTQVKWVGERQLIYSRLVKTVLNRSGLETAGSVYYTVDPAFEVLKLVSLTRTRNGVVEDLKDQTPFRTFQRETDLERGIIDGSQTVYTDLRDVRIGDVIEAAVIWEINPRYDGSTYAGRKGMEYSVPVGLTQILLHWPADKPIRVVPVSQDIAFTQTDNGDTTTYRWRRGDIAPLPVEDEVPDGYITRAFISYSGYQDWDKIASAFRDYYNQPQTLSQDWLAKVEGIRKRYNTPSERTIAALRLVQDEIRYVGIEIGAGGYFARLPQTVTKQGFGDCKDKALLLKTTLAELGIDSDVALAHLTDGYLIKDRLPSGTRFNHMIVGAMVDGKRVWMDPTRSNEGGTLAASAAPDYGYVLPLGAQSGEELVRIIPNEKTANNVESVEMFYFSSVGLVIGVTTTFIGEAANSQRAYWESESHSAIRQQYFDYYIQYYPGLRTTTLATLTDDREQNEFLVEEVYFLPMEALNKEELIVDFPFLTDKYLPSLKKLRAEGRRAPLAIPYHFSRSHRVVVRNAPINFSAPDELSIDNPAFSYRFEGRDSEGGNMELKWTFRTRARQVPAKDVPGVLRDIRKMNDNSGFRWNLTPDAEE